MKETPELRRKLAEALNGGHYLVTITTLNPRQNILNHFYCFEDFKRDDLIPSLKKLISDVEKNELGKESEIKPS